jgi:hypothetical protein
MRRHDVVLEAKWRTGVPTLNGHHGCLLRGRMKKTSRRNRLHSCKRCTLSRQHQLFIAHRALPIAVSTSLVSINLLHAQLVPTPAQQTPRRILDLTLVARPIIRTKIKIWRTAVVVAAALACWDVRRVRVSIATGQHRLRAYMRLASSPQAHPLLE